MPPAVYSKLARTLDMYGCDPAKIRHYFDNPANIRRLAREIKKYKAPDPKPKPKPKPKQPPVAKASLAERSMVEPVDNLGWTIASRLVSRHRIRTIGDIVAMTAEEFCHKTGMTVDSLDFHHVEQYLACRNLSFKAR